MQYQTIVSSDVLLSQLTNPNWIVIDCRFDITDAEAGRRVYRVSHITGAHYAHLDEDLSGPVTAQSGRHPLPDPDVLCDKLGTWGVTPGSQVVVYDAASGAMAARLWWLLRWLGHRKVAVLDGGWQRWQAQAYPRQQAAPVGLASHYPGKASHAGWLDSDQVLHALEQNEIVLLDARAAERFEGRAEAVDPVAGHVPGAINRPLQLNLDNKGCFKPAAQLRQEYEALLTGRAATEVVHMCGSGITACHNQLAMEIAGLGGSSLYVGSWSEWIRDPARPLSLFKIDG